MCLCFRRQEENTGCYYKDSAQSGMYTYETYAMRVKLDPAVHNVWVFWLDLLLLLLIL